MLGSTVNEVYFSEETTENVIERQSSLKDPKQASSNLGPRREYPFLENNKLTSAMDIQALVTYDTVDIDGYAADLKLDSTLRDFIIKNVNEALGTEAKSPKFNRETYINARLSTLTRMLRPELVKEEAGVMSAAEELKVAYMKDQEFRAKSLNMPLAQLKKAEKYATTPAMELTKDFKEWVAPQWEEARREAIEVMLEHVDPRFTYEVALATGFINKEQMNEVERVQKKVTERNPRQLGRVAVFAIQ